jgi:hypothetical protein
MFTEELHFRKLIFLAMRPGLTMLGGWALIALMLETPRTHLYS